VADIQFYYFGIILILGAASTFYYLYGSSEKYFARSKAATRAAIHRLDRSAESTDDFFDGYETIHEAYDTITDNAHAYLRFGMGLLATGAAVIGFNFAWDVLVATVGATFAWLLVLLAAALIWSSYLNLKTIRGIGATLRLKPVRYVFTQSKRRWTLRRIRSAFSNRFKRHKRKRPRKHR
jgi:hypothetical protein